MSKTAIVVGAGLAGTAAAFKLTQAGWQVKLIESTDQLGGRANSVAKNGYLIDTAASGVAGSYADYFSLAKEAGVDDLIKAASPYVGLIRDYKVHELDMRSIQWSGLRTGLLSLRGKLGLVKLFRDVFGAQKRGMLDYTDLGKAAPIDNESTSSYAVREFSKEISDYFCDPLVRVMTLANGDKISKVEFFSGVANILTTGSMYGMLGGQQHFANVLARGAAVEYLSSATSVRDIDNRVEVRWSGPQGDKTERADVCVVACPLPFAYDICPDYRPLLEPLNKILRYTRVLSVGIGASVQVPTRSFMLLAPNCEEPNIACYFLEHNKNHDRAPKGHSLITAYHEVGVSETMWDWDDERIVAQTLESLYRLFPVMRGKVDMTHVKRWSPALPLMQIGGFGEISRLNEQRDPKSRVQFAGDWLSAAGQNTAVAFGVEAAKNIIANRG